MKRMLCGAVALLLLFGALGCRIASNAPEAPTDAAETAAPTDAPETTAEAAAEETPFDIAAHQDSYWSGENADLRIDEHGNALLKLGGLLLDLVERDDGLTAAGLEFSESMYAHPCFGMTVALLKLLSDGDEVQVQIVNDPYGAFSDVGEAPVLSYQKPYHERFSYHWPDIAPSRDPAEQPGTDWQLALKDVNDDSKGFQKSEWIELHSEDGQVRGTWTRPDGTVIPCVLLTNQNAAVVCSCREDDASVAEDVLLFGKRAGYDIDEDIFGYVLFKLASIWCAFGAFSPKDTFFGSQTEGTVWFHKASGVFGYAYEQMEQGDYTYCMGVDRRIIELNLTENGWQPIGSGDDFNLGKYQKDGDTLLIAYIDVDTFLGFVFAADGYACYDETGAVKAWGGLKPIDHTVAESYTAVPGETDFFKAVDAEGYYYGEGVWLYFTDDMRLVIRADRHTGGGGDYSVSIEPVYPAE